MLVTIDTDQLVRDAAAMMMDRKAWSEQVCLSAALKKQLPEDYPLLTRIRQQVKEYKKLTMWR